MLGQIMWWFLMIKISYFENKSKCIKLKIFQKVIQPSLKHLSSPVKMYLQPLWYKKIWKKNYEHMIWPINYCWLLTWRILLWYMVYVYFKVTRYVQRIAKHVHWPPSLSPYTFFDQNFISHGMYTLYQNDQKCSVLLNSK